MIVGNENGVDLIAGKSAISHDEAWRANTHMFSQS